MRVGERWAVTREDWQAFGLYLLVSCVLVLVAIRPGATRDQIYTAVVAVLLVTLGVGAAAARLGHRSMWRGFFPGVKPVREWLAGLLILVPWIAAWFIIASGWDIHGTAIEAASWFIWAMAALLLADLVGRALVARKRPATSDAANSHASV